MENQNKNLILATVLSFLVILVWFVVFPPPEAPPTETPVASQPLDGAQAPSLAGNGNGNGAAPGDAAESPRFAVDTPSLKGSVALVGGRIDDLQLKSYRETIDPTSENVRLLSPVNAPHAYYALYGWQPGGALQQEDVPGADTLWRQVGGGTLSPGQPVALEWDNGKGLIFRRDFSVDDKFMFTVKQSVQNTGAAEVKLAPYALVARHGKPADLQNYFISHEGMLQMSDGILTATKYDAATEAKVSASEGVPMQSTEVAQNGWIGFSDKYWMATLIPAAGKPYTAVQKYFPTRDVYQTEARMGAITVAAGETAEVESRLFAGAKEWATIRGYENDPNFVSRLLGSKVDENTPPVDRFIDSIDWGWFFFLTKPIFAVLHWLNATIGNMGVAIICLTFLLKALVLPLAYKSYVSMARMKELQPEMEALKERAGDDRAKLQQEMMKLYREKKVNPAAGCLPMLLQIPIFFSLYKVIFVTLELRQAPFFGVFQDLSMPDPTSLFNLFGALPWAGPAHGTILQMVFIGVLAILLGISMWFQQKLNPAPADPVQAQVFGWMPWIFMFILGGFASGLVIYWITNNVITFVQQYAIMRSHGHKPDLFGNIKASFKRKPAAAAVAANKPSAPKAPAKAGKDKK